LNARLRALQALLDQRDVDLVVLQYATDLYYYTGSVEPSYLLVPRRGAARMAARKALERIQQEAGQLPLQAFASSAELAAIFAGAGAGAATHVGLTADTLSYASALRLHKFFPQADIVDLSWDIRTLRLVKSEEEIDIQRRAGQMMAQMDEQIRAAFYPGISELALSAALECACRAQGHDMLIRCRREGVEMSGCGICVAGQRTLAGTKFEGVCGGAGLSPAAPYGATACAIAPGEPILVDFAFMLEGYHLDQTRMACWGAPSAEVRRAYDAMLQVQAAVFAVLQPGVTWETPYRVAEALASELGYADIFMGSGREQVKFIGHGVGLELDEPPILAPRMADTLAANMVLAIEPKVALPEIGVVGIEDTVVIRPDGVERLTVCPQEIVVLS